jgi:hypothetical protein
MIPLKTSYAVSSDPPYETGAFSRSGDDELDEALIQELKNITRILEVNPGFKYLSEKNAFATGKTLVDGTNGTVLLGLPLIKQLLSKNDGGAAVAGICAHECGHIYQYQHGLVNGLRKNGTIVFMELHADFIGGYYIGKKKGLSEQHLRAFSSQIYELGDYSYRNPATHGSPGQRAAAVEKGYRTASEGVPIAEAAEIGMAYVMNL